MIRFETVSSPQKHDQRPTDAPRNTEAAQASAQFRRLRAGARNIAGAVVALTSAGLPTFGMANNAFFPQTNYGVICEIKLDGQRDAPGTVSGILNVIDQTRSIDVTTRLVPAELGLSFGIRATLGDNSTPLNVDVVVTHPPMGPGGQEVEIWTATLSPGETSLNLFTFEEPFELIQGPWRFELRNESDVLLSEEFVVTPPGSVPEVQQACKGALVLS